jgi:hypothetical protein
MTMGTLSDCGCSTAPKSATGVSGHRGRRAGSFKGMGRISNKPAGTRSARVPSAASMNGLSGKKYECRKVRGKWQCEEKSRKRRRRRH